MAKQTIQEKIKQRRRQMLVHSYLYYEKNENIVSDSKWSQWAMELVQLQKDYPEEASEVEFAEMFKDWDGSSGAFLNFNGHIIETAERLLKNAQCTPKTIQNVSKLKLDVVPKKSKIKSETKRLF